MVEELKYFWSFFYDIMVLVTLHKKYYYKWDEVLCIIVLYIVGDFPIEVYIMYYVLL